MADMTDTTDAESPVRWGILSTANIGVKAVIPGIQKSRNGQIVAIASRELAAAERLAARVPGARALGNYEALLEDPRVEAIYIPLPNGLHAEWTIRAAEHGKHVLCEKPLGASSAEVIAMRDACQKAQVLLLEAFMYRFHPQIHWAVEQLHNGAIGNIRRVRSAFAFDIGERSPNDVRLNARLAGGSLMDVICYPLNITRLFFGGAPQSILARAHVPAGSAVEYSVTALFDYGDGRLGIIDGGFELPWHQYAEVLGDEGRIFLPRPFTPGLAEAIVRIERDDQVIEQHFAAVDQYQLEVEHFGDCIRNGTPLAITPEDAIEQAQTIEAVYAAAGYQIPW